MKKLFVIGGLVLSLCASAADPTLMVLQFSWQNQPGGVSPTGFILQKAVVSAGNTNWSTTLTAPAPATNMTVIQPYTALELDWRLAATNFYGTSDWVYARSPGPVLGVGEVPKVPINVNVIRK